MPKSSEPTADPRIAELAMLTYKLMMNEVWPRMKRDGLTWKDVAEKPNDK